MRPDAMLGPSCGGRRRARPRRAMRGIFEVKRCDPRPRDSTAGRSVEKPSSRRAIEIALAIVGAGAISIGTVLAASKTGPAPDHYWYAPGQGGVLPSVTRYH